MHKVMRSWKIVQATGTLASTLLTIHLQSWSLFAGKSTTACYFEFVASIRVYVTGSNNVERV